MIFHAILISGVPELVSSSRSGTNLYIHLLLASQICTKRGRKWCFCYKTRTTFFRQLSIICSLCLPSLKSVGELKEEAIFLSQSSLKYLDRRKRRLVQGGWVVGAAAFSDLELALLPRS